MYSIEDVPCLAVAADLGEMIGTRLPYVDDAHRLAHFLGLQHDPVAREDVERGTDDEEGSAVGDQLADPAGALGGHVVPEEDHLGL